MPRAECRDDEDVKIACYDYAVEREDGTGTERLGLTVRFRDGAVRPPER